ncbi:MAG: AAA family ATPase [Candidatus Methylarchaceae archaeon HK01B]|nr:AAA family ATPase [Candidatus Methylarchaceae archaeon HK01M]MCP8318827.1 AAA family ATPase [Candidatus Methylarchaceae archaeon HK01B]
MKVAIAGKGGVGKTTLSGTLARLFAKDGYKVIAIDADPAMNLSSALGIPLKVSSKIVPLSENHDLIEERTGARPGSSGSVFSLTPTVHDIAEKYGVLGPDNTRLIVLGTVKSGGDGCMCPANALLRALLRHILIAREDIVLMDMEAGLEHLGRGTVRRVDIIISVVEPRMQSIETACRIFKLAHDIEVKEVLAVGNKVRNEEERGFLNKMLNQLEIPIIGMIPYDEAIAKSDMVRVAPIDFDPDSPAIKAIHVIKKFLIKKYT